MSSVCFTQLSHQCFFYLSPPILNSLDARSWYTDFAQTSLRHQKSVYHQHGMLTPVPEVGIPTARYTNARRQKSVYRLCSNAYWHRNARVIEIQTRQQLKIFFPWNTANFYEQIVAFGHLAALGAVIFQSYVSTLYIRIDIRHLCLASIVKFCDGDFEENVEEMVGTTKEAAGADRVRRGRELGRNRRSRGRDRRQDGGDGWWRTRRRRPVG